MIHITLRQNEAASFMQCPFKYYMKHDMKYKLRATRKAINIGSLFSKGVEIIHLDKNNLAKAMQLVSKEQEKLLLDCTNQEKIDEIETDTATVQAMLYGYQKHFLEKTKYYIQPEYVVEWTFKLFGVWITYVCHFDGRLLDVANNPYILEIKTSSGVRQNLLLELPTNFQINSYWLTNYKAKEEKALAVVYRFAVKPTIRMTKKENADQFRKRVIGEYEKNTTKYFYEEEIFFDLNAIGRFEKDLMSLFESLIMCTVKNKWPRHGTACQEKYGSFCEYIRYCGNPTQETLDTYYTKETKHEPTT